MSVQPIVATSNVVSPDGVLYTGTLVDPCCPPGSTDHRQRRGSSADTSDPSVRRVVYNLYRGLLGTYNDKANDIISTLPPEQVREDQGIAKQIESMIKQSEEISGASPGLPSNMADAPPAPPPPPPPPPMPGPGAIPVVRLNSEIARNGPAPSSSAGGKHLPGGGAPFSYMPPAAIQNAMMTKDKKPFTYLPGGVDFLAEIRSPRMQRRISKNAMDEGVSRQPPPPPPPMPSNQSPAQLSPQAMAAMQPQIAVPVFPVAPDTPRTPPTPLHHVPQPPPPPPPAALRVNLKPAVPQFLTQHSPLVQNSSPPQFDETDVPAEKSDTRPNRSPIQDPPPAPPRATEKAPSTPSPPSETREQQRQLGTIYVPPVMTTGSNQPQQQQQLAAAIPSVQLSKAPMPWMHSQARLPNPPATPPYVNPQERVIQIAREDDRPAPPTPPTPSNVRVIPIAVEGRSSAPPAKKEETKQEEQANKNKEEVQLPWLTAPGKVIPIHLESCTPATLPVQQRPVVQQQQQQQSQQQHEQPPWRTQAAANANQIAAMMEELMTPSTPTPRPASQPTQSRSFRILQMIHDPADEVDADQADASGRLSRCSVGSNTSNGSSGRMSHQPPVPGERKLHLTQEDRELMDMFRSQVNEESSLHQESDPRYRGSHIPSRAFRILQNFTAADASEGNHEGQQRASSYTPSAASSQGASPARSRVSTSEQNEAEPRKYMGASIPSRSFRMLQAMTSHDPANASEQDLENHHEIKSPSIEMESIGREMTSMAGSEALDSGIERSKNPTPCILIHNSEEAGQVPVDDHQLIIKRGDEAPNHSEMKSDDLETDGDSDAAADHHSRLLRLLSNETDEPKSDSPIAPDDGTAFLPLELPGVRLRVRSLRAKDRIPSRLFRSLQHEFDSSSEDIRQPSSSSASPPAHPASSGMSAAFRFPHLYASVTPETPSSATSELEAFFPPHTSK